MITVIYVLGAGNSGSTIFSMALGGHSRITSIGELSKIGQWFRNDEFCSCGERMSKCQFWNEVRSFDESVVAGSEKKRPLSASESGKIYNEIARKTGSSVIVDASKDSKRMMNLVKNPPESVRLVPVLLSRSGQSYIQSMKRRPHVSRRWRMSVFALYRWVSKNIKSRAALAFAGCYREAIKLDFEGFVNQPEEHLRNICQACGIEYERAMLDFWKKPHHNIAGTPSRFRPKPITSGASESLPLTSKLLFSLFGGNLFNAFFGIKSQRSIKEKAKK